MAAITDTLGSLAPGSPCKEDIKISESLESPSPQRICKHIEVGLLTPLQSRGN